MKINREELVCTKHLLQVGNGVLMRYKQETREIRGNDETGIVREDISAGTYEQNRGSHQERWQQTEQEEPLQCGLRSRPEQAFEAWPAAKLSFYLECELT